MAASGSANDQLNSLRWVKANSRVLELANPSKFLALDASGEVGVALDLLLTARHASNGKPLSGLARLGHPPVSIHSLPVDHGLAVTSIVVEIAKTLARHLSSSHKPREEVSSGPDLGTKTVLSRDAFGGRRAGWCWWWVLAGS